MRLGKLLCRSAMTLTRGSELPRKQNKMDDYFGPLTVSELLSVALNDGTVVNGVFWTHASGRGGFEVEYHGRRHSDYRRDYTGPDHMRGTARIILAEMVGGFDGSKPA